MSHRIPLLLLIGLLLATTVNVRAVTPQVTTTAATAVTDVDAVMNGIVDAMGGSLDVRAEYGTTASYGTITQAGGTTVSGTGAQVVGGFHPVAPLAANTTYHFRLTATDGTDTYVGNDLTFTTTTANTPPSVSAITTNLSNVTTATLGCTVYSGSSDATIFWEYQAAGGALQTTPALPSTRALNTTGAATGKLTGLQPSTTYTCRCGATNGQGTAYSDYVTFTTLVGATITTAAASSVADVSALLSGTVNANVSASYAIFFDVGPTTDYGTVFYPTTGNTTSGDITTTFAVTATYLLPSTTYHFRLRAMQYSGSGNQIVFLGYHYGTDQTFTTGPPATPPTATPLSPTGLATTAATLNASVETGSSPTTVVFEYGPTTAYGATYTPPTAFDASTTATPSCLLQGLTANTPYHYRIIVTNGEGTSTGLDMSFTTLAPPTVTTDAATSILANSTTLNGTYNRQNGTYTIAFEYGTTTAYGQTAAPGNIIIIGGGVLTGGGGIIITGGGNTPQTTSTGVAPLLPSTTYHYRLKLTDSYGNNYEGADASFTTVTPVQGWRQAKFHTTDDAGSAADLANPAGDGIPNLLKYALNLEPATAGSPPQPQLKDYSGAQYLSLTFTRDPNKTDITYAVQAADSPAGPWTTLATSAGGAATSGSGFVAETPPSLYPLGTIPPMTVEVRDTISMQTAPRRFMRLQVTRQ